MFFAKPPAGGYIPLPPSKWDFFVYSPFEGGLRGMFFAKPSAKVYIPLPPSKGEFCVFPPLRGD